MKRIILSMALLIGAFFVNKVQADPIASTVILTDCGTMHVFKGEISNQECADLMEIFEYYDCGESD